MPNIDLLAEYHARRARVDADPVPASQQELLLLDIATSLRTLIALSKSGLEWSHSLADKMTDND